MKLFAVLIVCLALAASPCHGNPFIFDVIGKSIETAGGIAEGVINGAGQAASGVANAANGIAQAAINVATEVGKGAVEAGEVGLISLNTLAASAAKNIGQAVENIRNAALKATIRRVQETIQNISQGTQRALEAAEQAGNNVRERILEVEDKMEDKLETWADNAKAKVADADDETRQAGEKLVDQLTIQRTEELKQCTDSILSQLEDLQEQANATAKKYYAPTQDLIAEIGNCENQSTSRCTRAVAEKLKPLASAPAELAALKLKIDRAALTNIRRNVCIARVLTRFAIESRHVEENLDILMKGVSTTTTTTEASTPEDSTTSGPTREEGCDDEPEDDVTRDPTVCDYFA